MSFYNVMIRNRYNQIPVTSISLARFKEVCDSSCYIIASIGIKVLMQASMFTVLNIFKVTILKQI